MIWIMSQHPAYASGEPSRVVSLQAGEHLFRQGDPATAVYQVQSGSVRLERTLASGSVVTLAIAAGGQTLAEAAVFSPVYRCDAVALEASTVACFAVGALRERMSWDVDLMREMASFFAGQVHQLRSCLEVRSIRAAPDRLVAWLRLEADPQTGLLSLSITWAEVARQIGLTPEAVYRAVSVLQVKGTIERPEKHLIRVK